MPEYKEVIRTRDVSVTRASCEGEPADPEVETSYELVLIRCGTFRRETEDGVAVVDPTTAYVARPGQWQQIHHLPGSGDSGHVVSFSRRLLGDDVDRLPVAPVHVTPAVDLAVRRLAADAQADMIAVEEITAQLLASFLASQDVYGGAAMTPARRAAVETVRERLAHEVDSVSDASCLADLAADVGYAPHHLSRVFAAVTGTTIARHRRSLRVKLAVSRMEDSAGDLAAVAADTGFADHSHLVRAVRAEFGLTPTQMRRWLTT